MEGCEGGVRRALHPKLRLLTIACEQAADPAEAHGEGDGPRGCELVAVGCRHARESTREIASRELNGNAKVVLYCTC